MPLNLSNAETSLLLKCLQQHPDMTRADVRTLVKRMERSLTRIKTSSAKDKGRALQYFVCERISMLLYGVSFNQKDDNCLIHSREMGQAGSDIILRGDAQDRFPFTVECKSTESFSLVSTINQVKANLRKGTDWLIVHRRKALPDPIVILTWEAFERLLRKEEK